MVKWIIKRLFKPTCDNCIGLVSCTTYNEDGPKYFEEFVCCVTQHKYYSSYKFTNNHSAYLGETLELFGL